MDKRLRLMYSLLSPSGVIIINIDEHELAALSSLCQAIFTDDNVDYMIWQKTDSKVDRNTNAKIIHRFKSVHENINIVAILISFSVAIITILVSADNENIRQLKDRASSEKFYKEVNGKRLSLFQIMLSNIAYNTTIEVFYLVILIALSLSKTIVPIVALKIILSFCIVVIVHIFTVLLESVSQMYLTFWEKKE